MIQLVFVKTPDEPDGFEQLGPVISLSEEECRRYVRGEKVTIPLGGYDSVRVICRG